MPKIYGSRIVWSDTEILKYAKKFDQKAKWENAGSLEKKAYLASIRKGKIFHKNATAHMIDTKWAKISDILKDAKKYKRKWHWSKNSPGAYKAAHKKGIFKTATSHMRKGNDIYWTKETVIADAKKYVSKKQWKQKSSAINVAYKLGIIEEASKHFQKIGTHKKRCVYSISVKSQKIIYIGLTYNFKRRIRDHLDTKRFKDIIKLYGKESLIMKQLTEYIDVINAQKFEKKLITKFKTLKYNVLNIAKGGGVGGNTLIWTKEKIFKEAQKYKSIKDWRDAPDGSYAAAYAFNIYDEASSHLTRTISKPWKNKEDVVNDAKKYFSRTEWENKSSAAYRYAKRFNFFEEAIKHMKRPRNEVWTHERVIAEGKKYNSRTEWAKKSIRSYLYATKNKIIDNIIASKTKIIKWNKDKVFDEAKKYKTKSEWYKNDQRSYRAAFRLKIFIKATKHMVNGRLKRTIYKS